MSDEQRGPVYAVVGSRGYPDLGLVTRYVGLLAAKLPNAVVVSGGARGVDTAAEEAARAFGLKTQVFAADWATYGRRAGMMRNADIVEAADCLIAFYDGSSTGTRNAIERANKRGIPVVVFGPDGQVYGNRKEG